MIELTGNYNTAKAFTDTAEASAIAQVQQIVDLWFMADCRIRIMPDIHGGMYCPIGFTMTIIDKVVPNFVGVDIGCGMSVAMLKANELI